MDLLSHNRVNRKDNLQKIATALGLKLPKDTRKPQIRCEIEDYLKEEPQFEAKIKQIAQAMISEHKNTESNHSNNQNTPSPMETSSLATQNPFSASSTLSRSPTNVFSIPNVSQLNLFDSQTQSQKDKSSKRKLFENKLSRKSDDDGDDDDDDDEDDDEGNDNSNHPLDPKRYRVGSEPLIRELIDLVNKERAERQNEREENRRVNEFLRTEIQSLKTSIHKLGDSVAQVHDTVIQSSSKQQKQQPELEQQQPIVPQQQPVPQPQPQNHQQHQQQQHQHQQQQNQRPKETNSQQSKDEIIFLSDSNAKHITPSLLKPEAHVTKINRYTTSEATESVPQVEKPENVTDIVFQVGLNDLRKATPNDKIQEDYLSMQMKYRKKYPNARQHVVAIPPLADRHNDLNTRLQKLSKHTGTNFITTKAFRDRNTGQIRRNLMDGIHYNRDGVRLIAREIKKSLYSTSNRDGKQLDMLIDMVENPTPAATNGSTNPETPIVIEVTNQFEALNIEP